MFAFTGYLMKYRCAVPYCENVNATTYYSDSATKQFARYVEQGIPSAALENSQLCQYKATNLFSIQSCDDHLGLLKRGDVEVILERCDKSQLVYGTGSIIQLSSFVESPFM